jgi:hypothetical protein
MVDSLIYGIPKTKFTLAGKDSMSQEILPNVTSCHPFGERRHAQMTGGEGFSSGEAGLF